jgi:hypothetical protein
LAAQADEVGVVRTKSAVFPDVVDKVVPKTIGAELAVRATMPVQATLVPTPAGGHVTPLVLTTAVPYTPVPEIPPLPELPSEGFTVMETDRVPAAVGAKLVTWTRLQLEPLFKTWPAVHALLVAGEYANSLAAPLTE